jgi:hypothetical protein
MTSQSGLLEKAVARLSLAGISMPAPVEIRRWSGEPFVGCFIHIDRDLNGVVPSEAKPMMLQRSGDVREPEYGPQSPRAPH